MTEAPSSLKPRERPLGVTILAVLGFLFSALAILSGIALMAFGLIGDMIFRKAPLPLLFPLVAGAVGLLMLVLGGITLVVSWGLWTGQSWAWWIEVILHALNALFSLAELPRGIISLVISALILYYLFKPHVKEYFGVKVSFST
ncbi:hypothetical protein IG193_07320 [Infirmifilum lucidum]|uniref:Uncharacterized protein n=1 Tax=Infirmifilum lucidum TaxID=2776706 RepID=A0A7L9FFH0_9CREN|nr:hypothetical protein [Infirmifilum lucidum]QOJ78558.1 hypothetical protein IG193_07320 [Infirmifilum lucidum]